MTTLYGALLAKASEVDKLRMSLLLDDVAELVDELDDDPNLVSCEYLTAFALLEQAVLALRKAALAARDAKGGR